MRPNAMIAPGEPFATRPTPHAKARAHGAPRQVIIGRGATDIGIHIDNAPHPSAPPRCCGGGVVGSVATGAIRVPRARRLQTSMDGMLLQDGDAPAEEPDGPVPAPAPAAVSDYRGFDKVDTSDPQVRQKRL